MTDWFVGQKVECINEGTWLCVSRKRYEVYLDGIKKFFGFGRDPSLREIVTISKVSPWDFELDDDAPDGVVGLQLHEYTGDDYRSDCFRPLVDTKTDISLLERLLDPVAPKVKEFA